MPSKHRKVKHVRESRGTSWGTVRDHVYAKIDFYATRFITAAVIGIVVGFIAIVYSIINLLFLTGNLFDITVVIGTLIGVGAIVASLILLIWGMFWRGQVDKEKLF